MQTTMVYLRADPTEVLPHPRDESPCARPAGRGNRGGGVVGGQRAVSRDRRSTQRHAHERPRAGVAPATPLAGDLVCELAATRSPAFWYASSPRSSATALASSRRIRSRCTTLSRKRISPHVLRHTCALTILQATGDLRKVSLWLGHADMQTTMAYLRADPAEKLSTVAAVMPMPGRRVRLGAPDKLLASLHSR